MRLTCPTCSAVYDLPDDQLPAGGSHVQCSACHTRWFARAQPAQAPRPSEDEIIARLETRSARRAEPEPAAAESPAEDPASRAAAGSAAMIAFPGAHRPRPASEPTGAPAAASAETAPAPVTTPIAPAAAAPQAAAAAPAPIAAAEPAPTPLRPRPDRPAPPPPVLVEAPEPVRRRGGLLGFAVGLALAAAALGGYVQADGIAARAPALAPAAASYAERINSARDWIETRFGPLRDRLTGA